MVNVPNSSIKQLPSVFGVINVTDAYKQNRFYLES